MSRINTFSVGHPAGGSGQKRDAEISPTPTTDVPELTRRVIALNDIAVDLMRNNKRLGEVVTHVLGDYPSEQTADEAKPLYPDGVIYSLDHAIDLFIEIARENTEHTVRLERL